MTMRKSSGAGRSYKGKQSVQHWYRDNQVYFITARCRLRYAAFAADEAKAIFWNAFEHYTTMHRFVPWVTSLLDNHYHTLGYLREGSELAAMMKGLHGRTAREVNAMLEARGRTGLPLNSQGRLLPFWGEARHKTYFDGCLRDEIQARRTYRYVLTQCRRHGICHDPRDYPHTRIHINADRAIRRASQLRAFLYGVRYKRYES